MQHLLLSSAVVQVLKQDHPCTWALREYARDLDVLVFEQRLALIDDRLAQLLKPDMPPKMECK